MTDFIIRNAKLEDLSLLQTLGRKTFADTFSEFNTPENMKLYLDESFREEKVRAELLDPSAECMLIFDRDRCVGFARLRRSANPDGIDGRAIEIERIYADKDYIGNGVGAKLMHECIRRAKDAGFEMIWLGVWEFNQRAIRFYEKHGFEKFGKHIFALGNDPQTDWLFKKKI
jgi:ribosomal protein S18 acetylase RimI-like enzyme